jgi:hypothetical protein
MNLESGGFNVSWLQRCTMTRLARPLLMPSREVGCACLQMTLNQMLVEMDLLPAERRRHRGDQLPGVPRQGSSVPGRLTGLHLVPNLTSRRRLEVHFTKVPKGPDVAEVIARVRARRTAVRSCCSVTGCHHASVSRYNSRCMPVCATFMHSQKHVVLKVAKARRRRVVPRTPASGDNLARSRPGQPGQRGSAWLWRVTTATCAVSHTPRVRKGQDQ